MDDGLGEAFNGSKSCDLILVWRKYERRRVGHNYMLRRVEVY